jgi:hypothetical protein
MLKIIPSSILFCLSVLFVTSCTQNLNEDINKSIKPYVSNQLGVPVNDLNIKIISIDTLTEKDRLEQKGLEIYDQYLLPELPILEICKEAVDRTFKNYNEIPNSDFKSYYDEALIELENQKAKMMPYFNQIDKLDIQSKKADSKTFKAYLVNGIAKYTTEDNVQKNDSISVIVSKELKVIEKSDFLK